MDIGGMMEEHEQYEERISKRNRRRKQAKAKERMRISGRGVFTVQEEIRKRAERITEKKKGAKGGEKGDEV